MTYNHATRSPFKRACDYGSLDEAYTEPRLYSELSKTHSIKECGVIARKAIKALKSN